MIGPRAGLNAPLRSRLGVNEDTDYLFIIKAPKTMSRTPPMRPTHWPCGATLSTRTKAAIAATHKRLITPATKSSAIRNQQQPVQYVPVPEPHDECAARSFSPFAQNHRQRRSAVAQACVLQRRPLKYAGWHEQDAAKDGACADHHRRQKRRLVKSALGQSSKGTERRPNRQIAR